MAIRVEDEAGILGDDHYLRRTADPKEAIKLANARISRINNAWEKIKHTHQ